MYKLISFVFVFIVSYAGYSQTYFESNKIISESITYTKLQDDGFGKKIFSTLALENNIDVRKISLKTKARLLVRISRNPEKKITAIISLTKVNLDGNITIRDFNIDSLLWPSGFNATLTLYNGKQNISNIDISGFASGKQVELDITDYLSSNNEKLRATISEMQFNYDSVQFQQLQYINETIIYYYSYRILLNNLLNSHNKRSVSNNQNIEEIFISKIEVDRVSHYIKNHDFTSTLNLEKNDPTDFLKLTKKLYRLSNRETTLTNKQINTLGSPILNPEEFARYYSNLSTQYLIAGSLLQPNDASGYREFAAIDATASSKENLSSIINFYYQNTSLVPANIYQYIFDEFVDAANESILNDDYTDALLLLNNALIVQNRGNISTTQNYNSAVLAALDGLSSSYLMVGNVAINTRNQETALSYFSKADEVIEINKKLITGISLPDTAFANYLRLQHEIAMKYISLFEFDLALGKLNKAQNICSKLTNSIACNSIDSTLFLAHSGNFDLLLDDLDRKIEDDQFPDAYQQFLFVKQYKNDNSRYLGDDVRFKELSYSLFLELKQRGEILIDAHQPEVALDNLLKAKLILQFLDQDLIELERLISLAAEPKVINLIDEAKYHIWANRMDEAIIFKQKAVKLNEEYFFSENVKINQLLDDLNEKIKLRYCLSHEIQYSDAIKRARIAIKNNKFSELGKLLDEAEIIIVNYPQCNIQIDEVNEIRDEYNLVLTFFNKYNDILEQLYNNGYNEVIDLYISLLEFYNSNNIFHYSIYFPNLETFVDSQKLPVLTKATSKYFLENNNLDVSLQYIWMFKDQGGESNSAAQVNKELGKVFGIRDSKLKKPINEALLEYTSGDRWYSNFTKSYIKNRVLNKLH